MANPKRLKLAPIMFPKGSSSSVKTKSRVTDAQPRVLIKTVEGKWYNTLSEADALASVVGELTEETKPLGSEELSSILSKAEKLLKNDIGAYKAVSMRGDKRGDFLWMEKIVKTGTLHDKMAAFTVKIQDSPVHNLHCLQQLIGMVKSQAKQQCLMTADTARDLFLEDLLPPNRKLVPFEQRGTKLRTAGNKTLVLWLFEDKLKGHYRDFIEALRRMSSDTIDKIRSKAISVLHRLLEVHAEQEHILLPLIVNKLGDPEKKVASGALFRLNKILEQHPQMKIIVVDEVERLLFRNNIGKKAQYYGICFLNGIRILGDEASVAIKMVKVYLAFFKSCIKTGEIDGKMMSGLLNGVNKAFPVAKITGYEFTESLDLDTLYNIIQLSHFNIGVQALALLFQVTDGNKNSNQDRFYRVLYRQLLSPEVGTTSHSMQFLNVVFKAMKRDSVVNRVIGFSKRLLQLCNHLPPNLACAILFLISEVSKSHNSIILIGSAMPDQMTEVNDEEEAEDARTQKLIQEKYIANVQKLSKNTNIRFDLEKPAEVPDAPKVQPGSDGQNVSKEIQAAEDDVVEVKEEKHKILTDYDPTARNPAYCGAEVSLTYELTCLARHFHPSVALFSQSLLDRRFIKYDGNPLKDFTVSRFLERFVYRNPKQKKHPEYQPQGLRNVPVTSTEYLETEEHKIPIEEKFFYKYFKGKIAETKKNKVKKDEDELSDVESVDDAEFDEFMDNYFKKNKDESDAEDNDVDFAAEVKPRKKGKRKAEDEDDLGSEDDEDEEAIDFDEGDDADEFVDLDEGNDEMEGIDEGSDDDDDFEEFGGKAFKQKLQMQTKKFKSSKGDVMFAPAEEFAEMLESNAEAAFSGSNTLINKDNSNLKQLQWETQRDRWVKGYKNKSKDKFSKKRKSKK